MTTSRTPEEPLRMVILEDRRSDAELVVAELRRAGLRASSDIVQSREDFHRAIESNPDVIISDYNVPGFGAPDALKAVQATGNDAPFIIVSGSIGEDRAVEMIKAGAADYVFKDRLARLPQAIQQAVKARELRRRKEGIENALQQTIDAALDCIITIDESNTILEFNPAAEQTFGWSRTDVIGRSLTDTIVPERFREAHTRGMARLLATGEPKLIGKRIEIPALRANGEEFTIELTVIRVGTERPARFTAFMRDITDRVAARDKLEAQEKQYRLLFEDNPNPMLVFDSATLKFLAVNSRAEAQYGYTRDEFLELSVFDIRPAEDVEQVRTGLANRPAGRFSGRFRHKRKDGSTLDVEITTDPITFGGAAARLAVAIDVTERMRADEALRDSEERFSSAFELAPSGVALVSPEGRWLRVNQALCKVLGCAASEIVGKTIAEFTHPDDRQPSLDAIRRLLAGEIQSHHTEKRYLRKSGEAIWAAVAVSVIRDGAGKLVHFVTHVQDITDRRRAEEALRQSEREQRELAARLEAERARLVTAQRVAHVGDWETDFVTGRRSWSEQMYEILEVDSTLTTSLHELYMERVHPDERAAVKAVSVASIERELKSEIKHRLLMPDGRVKFVLQHWQVTRDENGRAVYATGTIQDVTEREIAAEVLRRSETNLAFAQRLSHTGSWEIILDHSVPEAERELRWSDEQFRIFGLEPRSVKPTQRLFFEFVHPDDRQRIAAAFAAAFASGPSYDVEHRIVRPDGTERVLHEQASFVRSDAGLVMKIVGATQDITERKQAEARIREQASLIDLAHDAILVRDMDNRVKLWNQGAERLYGWTAEQVLGRRTAEFLYADPAPMLAAIQAVLRDGGWHGELEHLRSDGSTVTVRSAWTLLKDEAGQPKSVLSINTDVSEQKRLQQQLLRAQRLESIGTLASGVAHDLNNILSPILMAVPILREEAPDAAQRDAFLSIIEQSAERGAGIVRQVLTFARGADGERVLIQPSHLVKEISRLIEETFPKTISLRTNYHDDLFMIEGDPTQLHQVLLNLCVNARDAMPHGGNLSISAENFEVDEHYASMTPGAQPGPYILINVADTGTGIPAHLMSKIFDPFFTTKPLGSGTGLGLSTVLGIVQSHHGIVTAYSTPTGSTFRVLLPASVDSAQSQRSLDGPDLPLGHGETLLIVDDEQPIRAVAESLLTARGYKVLLAEDGPEALAIFSRRRAEIALTITDLMMPVMSGLTLARTIRKLNPEAKVVISSSREEDTSPAELKAIGVEAVLTKPYTQQMLLRVLDEVLHRESHPSA